MTENDDSSLMWPSMRITVRGIDATYTNIHHMPINDFQTLQEKENFILLDTRSEIEHKISHIHGAVQVEPLVNKQQILKTVKDHIDPDQAEVHVVCYCSVGLRSAHVASKLQTALKHDTDKDSMPPITVHNLRGGIFQWATQSLPMEDCNNKQTKYVHPYSFLFGKLVDHTIRKSSL